VLLTDWRPTGETSGGVVGGGGGGRGGGGRGGGGRRRRRRRATAAGDGGRRDRFEPATLTLAISGTVLVREPDNAWTCRFVSAHDTRDSGCHVSYPPIIHFWCRLGAQPPFAWDARGRPTPCGLRVLSTGAGRSATFEFVRGFGEQYQDVAVSGGANFGDVPPPRALGAGTPDNPLPNHLVTTHSVLSIDEACPKVGPKQAITVGPVQAVIFSGRRTIVRSLAGALAHVLTGWSQGGDLVRRI
jgi:hypothetical protein